MLKNIEDPELFFGFIGAVGTDLDSARDALINSLQEVGYSTIEIRMSRLLHALPKFRSLAKLSGSEDVRINRHMEAGDKLRRYMQRGDSLALLAASAVQDEREKITRSPLKSARRHAYIFNSLKHPDEILTLRKIFGELFSAISIYSPRQSRIDRLAAIIAKSKNDSDADRYREKAEELVEKDAKSAVDDFGQNVRDTFPLADVFVQMSPTADLNSNIKRFIQALFGYPFHTPTKDEFGMFHAFASSLRSADLSRQVGAVITSEDGELVSVGCNEVPKAGGGSIWPGEEGDFRDFQLGLDSNAFHKQGMVGEVLGKLREYGWLNGKLKRKSVDALVTNALIQNGRKKPPLKEARIANIIEFGRIVHAEMAAVIDAARRGVPLSGKQLFCTTFPCHMCARHLIAAGLKRVVYIEPYPKSLAKQLYENEISVEHSRAMPNAVNFEPFVGVAPRKFLRLFEMPKRKDKRGRRINWIASRAQPKAEFFNESYLDTQLQVTNFIRQTYPSRAR